MANSHKFFEENLSILPIGIDPLTRTVRDPEKFNLYSGLSVMAQQLSDIQSKLSSIEDEVHRIKRKLDA